MIKVLILYYLSLKSTHGYEIQKFIQINHMDSWTKIQSGSIYYALAKLEKEGLVRLTVERGAGPKARKVYAITDKGREKLKVLVNRELGNPICDVGSDKFLLYPLLTAVPKNEIEDAILSHIKELEKKQADTKKWQEAKLTERTLKVEIISFEMMISSLNDQIRWHQALLSQLDQCIAASHEIAGIITTFDFSDTEVSELDPITDLENLRKKQEESR